MTHKISVTEDDIQKGVRADCAKCPVARAVRRAFPHAYVTVGSHINIGDHVHITRITTPDVVLQFINRFDNGLRVKPFEFDLVVPED